MSDDFWKGVVTASLAIMVLIAAGVVVYDTGYAVAVTECKAKP